MTQDWFDADSATFGDRLVAARDALGLTQSQLAAKVGVRAKTLQNWETDRSEPRANRLQMLAGVLNVSMVWLLTGVGEGGVELSPETDAAADKAALLAELREIRVNAMRLTDRMAKLEKKLRALDVAKG
ncbi:helix-turn-helix domain-containing protein [Rhodovulum sp. DZ06]|uniref:helix-turn-helix domain-containing protein n=1 Tax=Rhodovulum sp. DZ06 TaxID=3425126 RepID=UPI003D3354C8